MTWDEMFTIQTSDTWDSLDGDAEVWVDVAGHLISTTDMVIHDGKIIIKTGD